MYAFSGVEQVTGQPVQVPCRVSHPDSVFMKCHFVQIRASEVYHCVKIENGSHCFIQDTTHTEHSQVWLFTTLRKTSETFATA